MEVSWAVLHLSLVVPRRLAAKQFANPGLDTTAYVAEQIDKFRRRLAGAAAVIDDCQADRL